jgi:glucose-1-phosphate cytidylyltransferase
MKVVILAGGLGTRLSEYTESIPKPLVTVGNKPILWHIMQRYAHYGHTDFYLALGYKGDTIKRYFYDISNFSKDFKINLKTGEKEYLTDNLTDWNVSVIDTGLNTMTGGRVKRMKEFIKDEPFLLTYGDGVANIDIKKLIEFHKQSGKMVTVSAVRPVARFGELKIEKDGSVASFAEKPQTEAGWINGGYFVVNPEFIDFIEDDTTVLEKEPLERIAYHGELAAYKHYGFWQCMDTKRDRDLLEDLYENQEAPWIVKKDGIVHD